MKKCPFCAEKIQDEAIKCKHCGEWLEKKESIFSSTSTSGPIDSNSKLNKTEPTSRSSSLDIKFFDGKEFELQRQKEGEGFCLGCRSTDALKNLYYCRETDEYYHDQCISEGRKDIKENEAKVSGLVLGCLICGLFIENLAAYPSIVTQGVLLGAIILGVTTSKICKVIGFSPIKNVIICLLNMSVYINIIITIALLLEYRKRTRK